MRFLYITYIGGLIFPWLFYLSDLLGNNFDAHFSEKTRNKLRVKDNSFLKKLLPLKEGDIVKNGHICGHRYYLYPRVLAVFIQTIILLLGIVLLIIQLLVIPFIPNVVFWIVGGSSLGIWGIYTLTINIVSQGLHI